MKSFVMFIVIVLSVYIIGNIYLFVRGWQALEIVGRQRIWFAVIFWLLALSFMLTMILRMNGASGMLFDIFSTIGSFWIAVMLYGFLTLLLIDIVRIIGWATHIRPDFIYQNYQWSKVILFATVCFICSAILGLGYLHAHRPQATHLELFVDKKVGQLKELRVVMVSDIHLGHTHGRKALAAIVDAINKQQPDIVFLAGDTFDGSPVQVIKKDMGAEFARLQTKYGTFIVSGNHEYIGEREKANAVDIAFDYLNSYGVQALQDTVILIDNNFYVAGRKDKTDVDRKTISELLNGIDHSLPIISLDHQPYHFEEVVQAEIDLHLSGHTHHGQMFPLNFITRKLYEQDWGLLQKGKTNFYVSCGVGTWGPPIRTAGYSEVVVIDLKFN